MTLSLLLLLDDLTHKRGGYKRAWDISYLFKIVPPYFMKVDKN